MSEVLRTHCRVFRLTAKEIRHNHTRESNVLVGKTQDISSSLDIESSVTIAGHFFSATIVRYMPSPLDRLSKVIVVGSLTPALNSSSSLVLLFCLSCHVPTNGLFFLFFPQKIVQHILKGQAFLCGSC